MSTINKILASICFILAGVLVIASFFKGAYLFFEAGVYTILGSCFWDTYKKEKELDEKH